MKLRKIVSLFAAVTMMISSFAAVVSAEVTTDTPATLKVTYDNVTDDENYGDYYLEGYDMYSIKVSLENFPLNVTFASNKYTGRAITGYELTLGVETDSTDFWFDDESMGNSSNSSAGYNETLGTYSYGAGTAGAPLYPKRKSINEQSTATLLDVLLFVTAGDVVDITTEYFQVATSQYDAASKPTGNTTIGYSTENGLVKLPTAGPTFTDDTQKGSAATSFATNADGTYNVGVKAEAIVAGATASKIKFSFTTDDANKTTKTAVAEYVLPTTVEAGGVSVALNVTSIPAGVTLTYNGATVE